MSKLETSMTTTTSLARLAVQSERDRGCSDRQVLAFLSELVRDESPRLIHYVDHNVRPAMTPAGWSREAWVTGLDGTLYRLSATGGAGGFVQEVASLEEDLAECLRDLNRRVEHSSSRESNHYRTELALLHQARQGINVGRGRGFLNAV